MATEPLDQTPPPVVSRYLDQLDAQREAAFVACAGLSAEQIWQHPAPGEWSIGEILNHNCLVLDSFFSFATFAWRFFSWYGRRRRNRPYATEIDDVYRRKSFPMWVGFLWTPKYNASKPVSLEQLKTETLKIHVKMREFYTGKDEALLGNIFLYDPMIGVFNLINTLQIGIYHDQLHYDDLVKQARALRQKPLTFTI